MNWRNVSLIYAREIRDQLRDRRTLFMIAVLPLLLYPLLGMSVFQLSQFLRKSEPKVLVIGSEQLSAGDELAATDRRRPIRRRSGRRCEGRRLAPLGVCGFRANTAQADQSRSRPRSDQRPKRAY